MSLPKNIGLPIKDVRSSSIPIGHNNYMTGFRVNAYLLMQKSGSSSYHSEKKNVCIRITEEADVVVSERAWNFMVNLFNQCNDYFMLFFPICALQTGGPRTT